MNPTLESGGSGTSLDHAAALLIQLEPTNTPELTRLKTMLEELAFEGGLPPMAQARVAGAARRVAHALAGGGDAAAESLTEAGCLIEQVMDLLGDGPPTPAGALPQPVHATEPPAPSGDVMPAELDLSLLPDFISESREYMQGAEASLLALELNPGDAEHVNTLFRAFHTIKGTSAFLGLEPISEIAHHAESLFNRFRDGEIRCTGPRADVSLRAVDLMNSLLAAAERLLVGDPLPIPDEYGELLRILMDPDAAGLLADDADSAEAAPPEDLTRLGNILVAGGKVDRRSVDEVLSAKGDQPLGVALVQSGAASLTDVAQGLRKQQQQRAAGASEGAASAQATVRVRTDRLDRLVEMVGELVVVQSMVSEDPAIRRDSHSDLARKVAQSAKIVRELQDLSVSMRMVPLHATFQKMSRLVRDVARKIGRQVEFVTEGEDTEIERNLVDIIGDPLVHMIRNAVDHGIETPNEREAVGKPRTGTVRLAAYHSGRNVVIELQDDGRGLNRDKILGKAIAKGLVDGHKSIPEADILRLIFAPGFSTADQVTDLSGRGVGMDVVKRNIEAVRGRIEIASEAGLGCTFTIQLPMTLAVTDGMLVRVAGERYILPTVNLQSSFRPRPEMLFTVAGRGEMVLLHDELLPIVRLHRLFHIAGASDDPVAALLVIVGFGDHRCALLVDELLGQQQVIAKLLGDGPGKVPGVAGGAVLGDGRTGLVLDVAEIISLFQRAAA